MKLHRTFTLLFITVFSFYYSATVATAKDFRKGEIPVVEKLDRASNLFKSANTFYSGQPNLETLKWLNSEGVDLVINLRSEDENKSFTASAFNEEAQVAELGMKYISIPIDGYDSYTPENVEKLAEALNIKHNKVLIHCASCGRVSYFMMAYMVNEKGYTLAQAIEFGKQLKFKSPLEYLLTDEINWETKK